MGRPKGDAARSKARPSSSSLAASLLPSGSAAAAVGFGGYVGSSRFEASLSKEDPAPFLDLDSEMAQHLQRLSRKDPTTKIKALTSLSELVKKKKGKELLPLIPQWTFEYKKLILDYSRDVRRATHDVMTDVVTGVGRDLAPHLKSIMGPWWFSQFDLVSEVSQAAKSSLQAAFPAQEKRLDVLSLCSAEIFAYLEENLKLTPQNLSDKALASDELEEMYQQMISSSLRALATLIDILLHEPDKAGSASVNAESKLASKARRVATSSAGKLFSSHKCFLNFLKSESPSIRSATYSLLSSFIKNVPEVFNESDVRCLAPALLGVFRETIPICHSSMWEAVLLFSRKFPQSWAYLNVHKSVLNHLWQFLRNGCFGSPQVSYPALILFLEVMPTQSLEADKFFVNFFNNLLAGRSMCDSSSADQLSLLRATTECFLWGLRNASRYCDGPSSIHDLQVDLIDKVLVKNLWAYFFELSKDSTPHIQRKPSETLSMSSSVKFLQELGSCILEILSGINLLEQNLLSFFCKSVQESFLNMLQQGDTETVTGMRKMIDFLLLLERHSSLEDGLKLLSVSLSIFGPRKIVPVLICDIETSTLLSLEEGRDMSPEKFIKVFQEFFIPWCMDGYDSSTAVKAAKQDLLFSLLDDDCFTQQWSAVISYVFDQQHQGFDKLASMELLLEKARDEITKRSSGLELSQRIGSKPDHWHHELIESTAIALVRSSSVTTTSAAQFLCSVLGGSTEDSSISFVSRSSLVLIYRGILEKLLSFIKQSPLCSVSDTCSSLIVEAVDIEFDLSSPVDVIAVTKFAAEVIDGSVFSLKALNQEATLFSTILSSLLIIDLESRISSLVDNTLYELKEKRKDRNLVGSFVHAVCSRMNNQFWKSINYDVRKSSANILVQSIRSVVQLEDDLQPCQLTLLCASWMPEVLKYLSLNQTDEEIICGLLLRENDVWPMWTSPSSSASIYTHDIPAHLCDLRTSKSQRYVFFIDSLITNMGIQRFVVGHKDNGLSPQAWLSAEILCTWEWPGGSVQTSFLPALVSFCKSEPAYGSLLNSIFDILLNGALVHGEDERDSSGNMWVELNNQIEDVKEPFLRALVSLIFTLFKEDLWREEEAMAVFKMVTDKLFIGEEPSKNCLRIIPFIMSVIISPLRTKTKSSVYGDTVLPLEAFLGGWLERSLSFPPLVLWQSGEDMQDWFQLVLSCYPVNEKAEEDKALQRHVSNEERTLLLDLFRKQRQVPGASSVVTQLPGVQILLARLIMVVVSYCGNDFNEEDWDFVFSNLRRMIQSAVVVMEETSENVNDFISGVSSMEKEIDTLEGLGHIVSISDASLDNAKNALSAFSVLKLVKDISVGSEDYLYSLANELWDLAKDRILEGVLRLFFCTGLAEAIAASYSPEAASLVASFRVDHLQFWELVAQLVVVSSPRARDRAVRAVEFWGLSKGAISSMYAIMFSSKPIHSLQRAAYIVLSTESISRLAIVADGNASPSDESLSDQDSSNDGLPSEEKLRLRDEISCMVEKLNYDLLDTDLTAPDRVQTFLVWSLLLSHVSSLPSLTQGRERLVQHIQRTANPLILDSLFQHIPLEEYMAQSLKKKDGDIPSELSVVASAATCAITTGSSLLTVKSLWPIETENMASLAGAIYGLMLRVLPAYVREWFSGMRDRSASSLIEAFTRTWCSPSLIKNELSQIRKADFNDESFSVSISKSANEVVGTYTKDETGMDLVIRLPVSYPLKPVDVNWTKSIGISDAKQRKWLMSMLMFVRNQNGALAEAIKIWKRNSDKEYEGVEDCPICYSVIHPVNHSLPRRACATCKYKFHKACLDKWFLTSHKKARGLKKHLKRLNAPKHWMLDKLGGAFAPKPSSGPHKSRECLPLVLIIRNRLKYALTYREVISILMQRHIQVDGKVRTDKTYPAGFMDVVSIPKTNENFRLLYDTKGRFRLHSIRDEEAKFKLCKVRTIQLGRKGIPYLNTYDGRTIRYPDPLIKPNDTIKLDLEENKIVEFIKFDVGNVVMVTGGRNRGRVGVIKNREKHKGSFETIHIQDSTGHEFATRLGNVFTLGKGTKPWVSLPKGKGIKLTIIEEAKKRLAGQQAA
ncbi:E3 ubiquitin-protein ligase listerin [Raphanus sativus]|nr:E3 ubiquitin-protein ligase listerin [Raphanus sativus]